MIQYSKDTIIWTTLLQQIIVLNTMTWKELSPVGTSNNDTSCFLGKTYNN